jgi:hypothetical protein
VKHLFFLLALAAATPAVATESNVAAAPAAASDSHLGIRVREDNSTINVLPLSAKEASHLFGDVPSKRVQEVWALYTRVVDAIETPTKKADLPPLFLSLTKPPQMEYRKTNLAELNSRLKGDKFVVFDPINLKPSGSESYVALVTQIKKPAENAPAYMVLTFVYQNDRVMRVVFSFQPWVTVAQVHRAGDLYG